MRWDYEEQRRLSRLRDPGQRDRGAELSPDPTAPAGQTYAQALALGGVNINDYISNGNNRESVQGCSGSRALGFSYDLGGDQRHVLFGGAGRCYDRDLYDYLQLEATKAALPQLHVQLPERPCILAGRPTCIAFDPRISTVDALQRSWRRATPAAEVDMMNNDLKTPYSDQFSLGMRNRVGDWNTDATVARIAQQRRFRVHARQPLSQRRLLP